MVVGIWVISAMADAHPLGQSPDCQRHTVVIEGQHGADNPSDHNALEAIASWRVEEITDQIKP